MTVNELIEELVKLNPDTPVYLHNGDGEVLVDEIELDNFYGYIRKVVIK
jgi:hypothetical protein